MKRSTKDFYRRRFAALTVFSAGLLWAAVAASAQPKDADKAAPAAPSSNQAPTTPTPSAPAAPAAPTAPTVSVAPAAAPAPSTGKVEFIGADACLQCHLDHEGFKHNIHAKAFPQAKGISFEKSCETCHGPGSLHAAAGGDKNNPDFFVIKNPKSMKARDVSQTCLQCHSGSQRMHWLGSVHEAKNVSCTACHSVHNEKMNNGKAPLLAKPSAAETCYQCHAEKKAQIRKSAHMPLVEGKMGCTSCHNPHGSNADKLMAKNSVNETCYQCHQDKRGPFLWEHPPVRENCLNCHDPHGSHNDFQLVDKMPMLCQRCHIATSHFSSAYDANAVNLLNNRVFDQSCANCHSRIHGSNHPSGKRLQR